MITKSFKNAPKLSLLQVFAVTVQSAPIEQIASELQTLRAMPAFAGKGWQSSFRKLSSVIETGKPALTIFKLDGNSKLPFVAFSTLPGVTCPGAGACIDFCYSFRAWRYPAAFARQVQNAFLMRFNRTAIADAFSAICADRADGFDFRLYVDGDFASVSDVSFWMQTLATNPKARAYGYSKSFAELITYGRDNAWPTNYLLNLSSGHNADASTLDAARMLPITRGEFRAVSIGRKVTSGDHGTVDTNRALRAALPDVKLFPCPGKCGTCTGAGHACGMPALKGKVIAIAMH